MRAHTCVHTHAHALTQTHACACAHLRMHVCCCKCTHTHTHTHTCARAYLPALPAPPQASQQPFQADLTPYAACITLNCCPVQHPGPLQPALQPPVLVPHEQGAVHCMCPNLHHRVLRSVRLERAVCQQDLSLGHQGNGAGVEGHGAGWVFTIRATGGGVS